MTADGKALLNQLERLEYELTEQDTLVLERMQRDPRVDVPYAQRESIRKILREVTGLKIRYEAPYLLDSEPSSVRSELRSARAKVIFEKKRLEEPERAPESNLTAIGPPASSPYKKGTIYQTALNTYRVVRVLGEGANGVVMEVQDDESRSYALKALRNDLLGGSKQRRFQKELVFCMTSSHPNIIKVTDHGIFGDAGIPFFVMPLFENTLRKAMSQPIPPESALSVCHQLISALHFAHTEGVIHRDLKPENILCTLDLSRIVVADFGIARFNNGMETTTGERLANFTYAAPEQREAGHKVGPACDIWALGLILSELLTGKVPLGRNPPSVSSLVPNLAHLDSLIDQMLRQTPSERPNTSDLISKLKLSSPALSLARGPTQNAPVPNSTKSPSASLGLREYWAERDRLPITDTTRTIWERPRWEIWIYPIAYRKARFPNSQRCREFMLTNGVKGFKPYPFVIADSLDIGADWVAGESDKSDGFVRRIERWALFRSGQFVQNRAVDEIQGNSSRMHVLEALDVVTGALELAARMGKQDLLSAHAGLSFQLHGVDGQILWWPASWDGIESQLEREFWCQDERIAVVKDVDINELCGAPRQLALQICAELFAQFGWANPPLTRLADEQARRFPQSL